VKRRSLIIAAATGALALAVNAGVSRWITERRAKTVFPASQAATLLHPARRRIQDPRRMVAAFGVRDGERVLELGPGPGYFTAEAAAAAGPGGRVVAVDVQPAMLRELLRRLPVEARPRVRALAGDAARLPLASGAIDRAYLVAVLGEVPDAGGAIAEIARVLRPGGVVAFGETLTDPDYVREGELRRLCARAGLRFLDRQRHLLGYTMRFTRQA